MLVQTLVLMFVHSALCDRPHIVFIVADDLGWNDVSFHGSAQIPTPNIDTIAYNGVSLNRHYVLPACTPSRAALLTGKYPIHIGMQGWPLRNGEPRGLPLQEKTLPQRMQELGYVTRLVGKWHLGFHRSEYTPIKRGFHSFFGFWNGYVGYHDYLAELGGMPLEMQILGHDLHRDGNLSWAEVGHYATEVFTQEAVRLVLTHDHTQGPLFLQLAHLAVHSGRDSRPLEVPDVKNADTRFSYIASRERRLYAEMVRQLDVSVGRVFEALEQKGILNNTIVVFISDNGAPTIGMHQNHGSNWPLRGMKHTLFEGGVRGVAAIWSRELFLPGRTSDNLFHIVDWLPTLYSAAGGNVSDLGNIDGIDQWNALLEGSKVGPRQELLLNVDLVQNMYGIIVATEGGLWKLIQSTADGGKYDMHLGKLDQETEPEYSSAATSESAAGRALSRTGLQLQKDKFWLVRSRSTVDCDNYRTLRTQGSPCASPCLYNLIMDPCEKANVSPYMYKAISARLKGFVDTSVPQLNVPVDPKSNPALYNYTWVSWLDDEQYFSNYLLYILMPVIAFSIALRLL